MGGLVARSYMNEQTHQTLRGPEPGGDRVSQLITLATPHHGTPLANGSARVPGWESDWNWLAAQLDARVWNSPSQGSTLSSLQSNRADLRWDDVYPINWPGKYDGTVETNSWLAGVPHTYDYKITAFYGVIGGGGFIVPYGGYGPAGTEVPFGSPGIWDVMQQPHNTAQAISVLAVITERIMDNAFGSSDTIYSVVNDGVVPAESGEFAGSAATPISCTGRDHTQMIEDPQGLPCKSGPLFSSILSILGVSATSPPPLITISPDDSWSFGSINVGNSSLETFALSNDGGGTLTVTSVITSGDSEFSIVGAPISQFSLTPGTSQTVTVRFQPTSGGSKSAALIVNSNASNNSAKTISLTGPGVASNPCSYSLTSTVASVAPTRGRGRLPFPVRPAAVSGTVLRAKSQPAPMCRLPSARNPESIVAEDLFRRTGVENWKRADPGAESVHFGSVERPVRLAERFFQSGDYGIAERHSHTLADLLDRKSTRLNSSH